MFGHARLRDTIRRCCTESARQIVERVFEAVAAHVEDLPPEDDRTLVVIKKNQISA
jgi:serine phosphatase RsbU (regulator of sigma subunit)